MDKGVIGALRAPGARWERALGACVRAQHPCALALRARMRVARAQRAQSARSARAARCGVLSARSALLWSWCGVDPGFVISDAERALALNSFDKGRQGLSGAKDRPVRRRWSIYARPIDG